MSLITISNDLKFSLMAHHLEVQMTPEMIEGLRVSYVSVDNSKNVPYSVFTKALAPILAHVPEDIRRDLYRDNDMRQWFAFLDDDFNGLVEISTLMKAFSTASIMRRYPTVLQNRLNTTRWTGPSCEKLIWIDQWRRLALCSSSTPDITLYSSVGTLQNTLKGHTSTVLNATYVRQLGQLFSCGCDRLVCVWDSRHSNAVTTLQLECCATAIEYSPTAGWVFIALMDGTVHAYPPSLTGAPLLKTRKEHEDWIKSMLFIPELQLMVTASLDRTVNLWSGEGDLVCRKVGHSRSVTCLAYMAQTRLLFSAGQGREIMCWNPFSVLQTPAQVLNGHEKEVAALFSDQINTCLISVDVGTRVVVWDIKNFSPIQVVDGGESTVHHTNVKSACYNPVNREVFILSDYFTRISASLASLRPPILGNKLIDFQYCESDNLIAAVSRTHVYVFDAVVGELARQSDHPFGSQQIAYAALTRGLIILSSFDARVLCYRITKRNRASPRKLQPVRLLCMLKSPIMFASFSHDGKGMAMVLEDGTCSFNIVKARGDGSGEMSKEEGLSADKNDQPRNVGDAEEIVVVLASSLVLSGVATSGEKTRHVAFSTENNLACIIHGKDGKPNKVTLWNYLKSQLTPLDLGEDGETSSPCQSVFLPDRNALAVLLETAIVVFNVGTFRLVGVYRWDMMLEEPATPYSAIVSPVEVTTQKFSVSVNPDGKQLASGEQASTEPISVPISPTAARSPTALAKCFKQVTADEAPYPHLRQVSCVSDDILWCTTTAAGFGIQIDLYALFSKFFGSQPDGIVDFEAPVGVAVHNVHFAVEEKSHQRESMSATILFGNDRRTNEPVVLKINNSESNHKKELKRYQELGETNTFVSVLAHWEDNTNLSVGTAPRAIVLERGEVSLKDLIKSTAGTGYGGSGGGGGPTASTPSFGGGHGLQRSSSFSAGMSGSGIFSADSTTAGDSHPLTINATPEEKQTAILCLLEGLVLVHSKGLTLTDLRPRNLVRVGEVWKLCGANSLRKNGSAYPTSGSVAYSPPELCDYFTKKKMGSYSVGPEINMWALGVIALETARGTRWLEDRNEERLCATVKNIGDYELNKLQEEFRHDFFTKTIVDHCLKIHPGERKTSSELLDTLTSYGFVVDYTTKFTRAMCHANVDMCPLPPNITRKAVKAVVTASELNNKPVPLPSQNVALFVATDPNLRLVMYADTSPENDGNGSIHLCNTQGEPFGVAPPPEVGQHDDEATWRWPSYVAVEANEAKATIEAAESGATSGGWNGDGEQEDPEKFVVRTMNRYDELRLPEGWKRMSEEELRSHVEESSKTRAEQCNDTEIDAFIRKTLKRAPFFRGGALTGDPLPLYSDGPKRRMNKLAETKLMAEKGDAHRSRKSKKLVDRMKQEVGLARNGDGVTPLSAQFLRSDPTNSTTDSQYDDVDADLSYDSAAFIRSHSPTKLAGTLTSPIRKRPQVKPLERDRNLLMHKDLTKGGYDKTNAKLEQEVMSILMAPSPLKSPLTNTSLFSTASTGISRKGSRKQNPSKR